MSAAEIKNAACDMRVDCSRNFFITTVSHDREIDKNHEVIAP